MTNNFDSQLTINARREGYEKGIADSVNSYQKQLAGVDKLASINDDQRSQIETLTAANAALADQLTKAMKMVAVNLASAADAADAADAVAASAPAPTDQLAEVKQARAKLRAEYNKQQADITEKAQRLDAVGKALDDRAQLLIRREQQLVKESAHREQQLTITTAEAAALCGDLSFATASLARQVVICDERAGRALALADAYPKHQTSPQAFEARREAQQWLQHSRNATSLLAKLPRPAQPKGNVDVAGVVTSATFLETCQRLAAAAPGRRISASGLLTCLLIEMPQLRTVNNSSPLTVRQLGNAFATIGIRSEPRRIPGGGKTEACYESSDFVILSSGVSKNAALPSQGSEDSSAE